MRATGERTIRCLAFGLSDVRDDGKRVYGLYLIPEDDGCDAPLIVELESA